MKDILYKSYSLWVCEHYKIISYFIFILCCNFYLLDVYYRGSLSVWESGSQSHVKAVESRIQGGVLIWLDLKFLHGKWLQQVGLKKSYIQIIQEIGKATWLISIYITKCSLDCQWSNNVCSLLLSPAIICPSHSLSLSMVRVLFAQLLKFNNSNGYAILHSKM